MPITTPYDPALINALDDLRVTIERTSADFNTDWIVHTDSAGYWPYATSTVTSGTAGGAASLRPQPSIARRTPTRAPEEDPVGAAFLGRKLTVGEAMKLRANYSGFREWSMRMDNRGFKKR